MKYIISLLLILTSLVGNAQSKTSIYLTNSSNTHNIIEVKGDTLFILDLNAVKFIKIGENIYKIESPVLNKVEKPVIWAVPQNNGWYYPNFSPTLADTIINQKLMYLNLKGL